MQLDQRKVGDALIVTPLEDRLDAGLQPILRNR